MPATRMLSNGHQVEELLYISVCKLLLVLFGKHEMRTDDVNSDWPNVPIIRALWIHCSDSSRPMNKTAIKTLSDAHLCNLDGYVPESIRNIILSITAVRKNDWGGADYNKNRVYMTVPQIYQFGPADPAGYQLEVDLGEVPEF